MPKQEVSKELPVHTIRHRRLKVVIWRNQTEKGVMYNVTVIRSYRDKVDGTWHDSHSFGYDDLMNVAALFSDARRHIAGLVVKEAKQSKPVQRPANRS